MHDQKVVQLNHRLFADNKPECFWHLCGRGENRQIDPGRAARLPWFRPVLENWTAPEVLAWEGEGTQAGKICRYLWLRDFDYLIILAPGRQGGWFLVTAHHVEGRRRRQDLERRRERGVKIS